MYIFYIEKSLLIDFLCTKIIYLTYNYYLGDIMKKIICDGASGVGEIAYKLSEVIPIYPITPSSPMAEFVSKAVAKGEKNILGEIPQVIEMQSEGGVGGTLHGGSLAHALATTFTSSQGLLLMMPNMFKIAGENLPSVIHVASRAVASHALSIFCDHSDVMAVRSTGFVILNSSSVQESVDMALASHMLALKSKLPVLHFFDGFRTSHEIQKIQMFDDEELSTLLKDDMLEFKNSFKEKMFGSAQNPDVFFQNRERADYKYTALPDTLQEVFNKINSIRKTSYSPYEYYGKSNAENILVCMGSACKTIEQYIDNNPNEKIGLIKVRLFRPFVQELFCQVLPTSAKVVTVLDRTKENGDIPPLAQDVIYSLFAQHKDICVIHGRYGLGGKDFTPMHVHSIVKNMQNARKTNFTVGIVDDVAFSNLPLSPLAFEEGKAIKIFGLGSDGSVSASKSTIKILGENTNKNVQGYFEYDSKKSGSLTISHLRICDNEIKSEYLIDNADVIEINNFSFVYKYDCLKGLKDNGIVIINSIFSPQEITKVLPKKYCEILKEKNASLFVINAQKIANLCGLGEKINIIMMSALFKGANLLNDEEITSNISKYINSMFASKGKDVIEKNLKAMEEGLNIAQVDISSLVGKEEEKIPDFDDEFYNEIMNKISSLQGDSIPVSKFSEDGSVPLDTSKFEKRNISLRLPSWIKENCIQCGQCSLACPHSALKVILSDHNDGKSSPAIGIKDKYYKISLSPLDCTGCGVCAKTCPAIKKAIEIKESAEILQEKKQEFLQDEKIPRLTQNIFSPLTPKGLQFNQSLFNFSGACAGCGETPYLKILTLLNGSNMMIANATGCSSIYSGSYPSCPYGVDDKGGIFWANSLFEDNAEFGLGLKLGNEFGKNKDKPVWIIGGDGWAYDIGFGGVDHILASGKNVNILVLDNQTYSNTGGQQSKATPTGAKVKFAENGKVERKKNLGEIALCYKDVYVGQICFGANMTHTIKTLKEAQDYEGTSIVIAYSTCVNQGFDMSNMTSVMKDTTECGFWPIYNYNPSAKKFNLLSDFDEEKYKLFLSKQRRFKNGDNNLISRQINHSKEFILSLKNRQEN